jgi:hypothetical protein
VVLGASASPTFHDRTSTLSGTAAPDQALAPGEHLAELPLLRPLGAEERLYQLFTAVHPFHFCIVAELRGRVSADALHAALERIAGRHPVLTATIEVDASGRAVFRAQRGGVPWRVVEGSHWEPRVAEELATPLPAVGPGSSSRVVLLQGDGQDTLVLTVAHHVADGASAVRALNDLLIDLNGGDMGGRVLAESREDLLAAVPPIREVVEQGPPSGPPPVHDERLRVPGSYLPFSGQPPTVRAAALDADLTAALREQARSQGTTVHGAVLAATAQELTDRRGIELVRLMSPISLLPLLDQQDGMGVFLTVGRSATTDTGVDFWELARQHLRQLEPARSPQGIGRLVAVFTAATGPAATSQSAAELMARGALGLDALVTNLGVVQLPDDGAITVQQLWGPIVLTHIDGEIGIGVATHGGQLRLTEVRHDDGPQVIEGIAARLRDAVS